MDRSAAVTLAATPGGFLRSAPAVPFSTPGDPAAVTCRTVRTGAPAPAFSACRSPYSPVTSGDGAYTVEVAVTDRVGNRGVSSHRFTLDATAPAGTITAGPGEGETLRRSDGAFAFTVSDASPVEVTCGLDGALAPCGGTSGFAGLPEGPHRFVLRIADAAGNVTELARSFSIDAPDPARPPIAPDPPEVLRAILFYSFAAPERGSTKLLALRLTQLPAGSRLDVRCSGRGCPAKRSAKRIAKAGKLALEAFAGRKLRKGARIEIRLTKPGAVGTFWRLTIVPRKPPRFERRCLDTAGAKPIRCPGA